MKESTRPNAQGKPGAAPPRNGELFASEAVPPPDSGDAWQPTAGQPAAAAAFDPAGLDASAAAPPGPAPDPFDPAALRIPSDFSATVGLKKAILSIQPRRPDRSWWVRAHHSDEYRLSTAVIEIAGERGGNETYLVAPHLRAALAAEPNFRPKLLVAAVTTQGQPFIWEVNLPRGGHEDVWTTTALEAVRLATAGWVRVAANMETRQYDVRQAPGKLPEPQWPELPFREWLRLAYKQRYIDTLDHPVLRRLRGEAP
jgi:hypothetical protein